MASKHMGDIIVVKVRRRLGRERRIPKVVVLEVRGIRKLIEKALESNVHSPCSKFVLPGSRVAGDTGGVFLALAGMKAGAN